MQLSHLLKAISPGNIQMPTGVYKNGTAISFVADEEDELLMAAIASALQITPVPHDPANATPVAERGPCITEVGDAGLLSHLMG